jgi:hypothetical protein
MDCETVSLKLNQQQRIRFEAAKRERFLTEANNQGNDIFTHNAFDPVAALWERWLDTVRMPWLKFYVTKDSSPVLCFQR